MRQFQSRLDRRARDGGGAVDVGPIEGRDQPVEREAAFHEQIDESRDEFARPAVALDDAAHDSGPTTASH